MVKEGRGKPPLVMLYVLGRHHGVTGVIKVSRSVPRMASPPWSILLEDRPRKEGAVIVGHWAGEGGLDSAGADFWVGTLEVCVKLIRGLSCTGPLEVSVERPEVG